MARQPRTRKPRVRLRWGGSIEAERQHLAAAQQRNSATVADARKTRRRRPRRPAMRTPDQQMHGNGQQQLDVTYYAGEIFKGLDYYGNDGRFLWQAAELWRAGLVSEWQVRDSIEAAVRLGDDRVAYFRTCLRNTIGGADALERLLSKVKVSPDCKRPPASIIERQQRRKPVYDDVTPKPQPHAKGMGDVLAAVLEKYVPGVILGDDLPEPAKSFEVERHSDPQGVIDRLIARTSRQAAEIYRLNQMVAKLEKQIGARGRQPHKRRR